MKEYIERKALKERFQKRLIWLKKDIHDEYSKGLSHGCETDMGLIDEILAADVAEVRHGRWIDLNIENSTGPMLKCSECSHIHSPNRHDSALERVELKPLYCETCGALMDGKEEP